MSLSHYRCDWIHGRADDPVTIFYEVDDDGRVLRLVDVFKGGRREREAVADYAGDDDSLVEGDFHASVETLLDGHETLDGDDRLSLTPVAAAEFEAAWRPDA